MDRARKREIYNRLAQAGLHSFGHKLAIDIRKKLRTDKTTTDIAEQAWNETWRQLGPLCDFLDKLKETAAAKPKAQPPSKPKPKPPRVFVGYGKDAEPLIDPDYKQKDPVLRNIDAYIWLETNFRRVVQDSKKVTTIDYNRAESKPPTVFTVQTLEEYALAEPGTPQRRALTKEIQTALAKLATIQKEKRSSGTGYIGDL